MKQQDIDYSTITREILGIAKQFGFLEARITNIKISDDAQTKFLSWIKNNFHGDMQYITRNINLRFNPATLHENTVSIICIKAPYLTNNINYHKNRLKENNAYISSYALGRDYHKVVKNNLKRYAEEINNYLANINLKHSFRVFTDSAPILEIELAKKAGLGWRGKNTLLINKDEGSMFFLGEIFTNLPLLENTSEVKNHCGSCHKCIDICPTKAFIEPYLIDAKKCISYLTIENQGPIPLEFRKAIGNRIYGCDDCQLFCPWNKFSKQTTLNDFNVRHNLDNISLNEAFSWDHNTWQEKMQGSSIYRIGYNNWLRNLAVALGNAKTTPEIISALKSKLNYENTIIQEHIIWALKQHGAM